MTVIAVVLALLLERALWHALHLRESGWVAGYYQWLSSRVEASGAALQVIGCIAGLLLLVLPVALAAFALDRWLPSLTWVIFAALVLVFSLGPRDLDKELEDYIAAETTGDTERARSAAAVIIEHDAAQRLEARAESVEEAAFVQANNRLFGVLFWFVLLGPTGLGPVAAWLFRASDLLRRAAIADTSPLPAIAGAFERMHFLLAWLPARLVALSYAIAGSFEEARREMGRGAGAVGRMLERNDLLLVLAGRGALAKIDTAAVGVAAPAQGALRLIRRSLLIWLTVIALLSLVAWVA
ncbi:MAG: regulatory signaling modulator protein AmpE [Gammaproteobacteria bacterium]|nr:regulatory signaling modulator protein AmpE [Gammaproteobacteria bacterium]